MHEFKYFFEMLIQHCWIDEFTRSDLFTASDRFTDAVKQLQDSLASLTASTQSLKMEVANLEQDLESTEIVNIMGDIVDGATSGTAYKYEHGSFKGTLTTVLSTIISLAYDEVLDDNTFFLNIMKFLSFLKDKYVSEVLSFS